MSLFIIITLVTEVPTLVLFLLTLSSHNTITIMLVSRQEPLTSTVIHNRSPIIILKPLSPAVIIVIVASGIVIVVMAMAVGVGVGPTAGAFRLGALAGAELITRAVVREVPLLSALEAAIGVAVDALADELGGAAVVGGDGGGEGAAVEHLPVHLRGRIVRVVARHELDEGHAAAEARVAVLEDGDARDAAEGGEERVEVGVREGVVDVRNVQR